MRGVNMKKTITLIMSLLVFSVLFSSSISATDLSVPKALSAPAIDGKINADEWANALSVELTLDNLNWVANANPSIEKSMYYFMWDADYLYFAADVKDTTESSILPAFGQALNAGDGTQLAIYGMDSTTGPTDGSEMLFFTIHPKTDSGEPDVYEHFNAVRQISEAKIASVFNGAAYTLECAIPFSVFNEIYNNGFINDIKGVSGQKWKMDLVIMDADDAGSQSLGTNAAWFDPNTSNTYTLADTGAGIDPTPAPVETPETAETGAAAPVETTAPQTGDITLISAVILACAAAVIISGKKR
jgi:hypothetical protein